MDYIKSFLLKNWYYLVIAILCLTFITYLVIDKSVVKASENEEISFNTDSNINDEDTKLLCKCKIDIKGEVKKPGVYELDCNFTIDDALKEAGGITKNGYTNNINLSKAIENEMVIYVYSKSEIKKINSKTDSIPVNSCESKEIYIEKSNDSVIESADNSSKNENDIPANNCIEGNVKTDSSEEKNILVNINEATQNELMTITGIGEAKAISIINYRQEYGLFKSIEDIKNVSGIGEALFEKIKNYIRV